jgi:hypothetical protein
VAVWDGEHDPRAGLEFTAQAAEATTGSSHVLTGLAVLHAAEAHAMRGHQRAGEQALTSAEDQFEGRRRTECCVRGRAGTPPVAGLM